MADEPRSLRSIFNEALELTDGDARRAFLESACQGQKTLLQNVKELLLAHESAGGFFGETSVVLPLEAEGATIGRYKLVKKIGEGGCGTVYLAEQFLPVQRQVALKVIKLGMDTRSVIARFEAERQALALMDHPNIAKVLDAGTTQTGRPFFVMELVRGVRITDFCDQHKLETPERLRLFAEVCHAVQHAHQKGIIHRDLKPSNILVASENGVSRPRIIDFGIAKATTDQTLTNKTLFTELEMFLGTPAYMSPEQADRGATGVDTRSDIYSLGVLLYELLTGHTPFDSDRLLKSGLDAMREAIRQTEPTRPSTRLSKLSPSKLTEIAQRRMTDPPRLVSLVSGDLDWIVLKALEKDRVRRYPTANAFARDVQRHLENEPVVARPPTRIYVLGRMIRRHRLAFVAGTAVGLALVVGLGAVSIMMVRERKERQRAVAAEQTQRQLRRQAAEKAEESRQALVRLNVAAGNKLVADGDGFAGLLHFVEAMELEGGDPVREELNRRRFASVWRLSPRLAQFWPHAEWPLTARFSPDGSQVVCGNENGEVQTYNTRTGETLAALAKIEPPAALAWFTPDGQYLATADLDGKLQHWDPATSRTVGPQLATSVTWFYERNYLSRAYYDSVDYSPNGHWLIAVVSGGARLFEVATGTPIGPLLGGSNEVSRVRFSRDSARAAICGKHPALQIVEVPSCRPIWILPELGEGARFCAFSPDGQRVATASGQNGREVDIWDIDTQARAIPTVRSNLVENELRFNHAGDRLAVANYNSVRLLDTRTGQWIGEPARHGSHVWSFEFSEEDLQFVSASNDHTVRVWDAANGKPASPLLRHTGPMVEACFDRAGRHLLTSSEDRTVRLWELRAQNGARLALTHPFRVDARFSFSPDGLRILGHGVTPEIRLWDARSGLLLHAWSNSSPVLACCFSPNGTGLAVAGKDGTVHLLNAATHEELRTFHHSAAVNGLEFSSNGDCILTASDDGTASIWNSTSGERMQNLNHNAAVRQAAFSPDGTRVITAGADAHALLWDRSAGTIVAAFSNDKTLFASGVASVAFSASGQRLLVSGLTAFNLPKSGMRLWDVSSRQPIGEVIAHHITALPATFSADGRRFVGSLDQNSLAIFDAETCQRTSGMLTHDLLPRGAAFNPDGSLVLTFANDFTARVWDARTGEPVTPQLRHRGPVAWGAWSPDGREVITASDDGTARIWDVSPTSAPVADLRRAAELLAAHRLDPIIGTVPLTVGEMKDRWRRFLKAD